ncbi:hypothetical protein ACET3X_003258 [Alternaria dauci]|uniref:Uncharacterized protein n=1 Tax=Alternaria dauci TaxID=48095 RepID=A0ABR3UUX4_9PLEO
MDDTSTEFAQLTITPIETLVACNHILDTVDSAIRSPFTDQTSTGEIGDICVEVTELYQQDIWPLITLEKSSVGRLIDRILGLASSWLELSPLFDANDRKTKMLKQYLEGQLNFLATGVEVNDNGIIKNRDMVLVRQASYTELISLTDFSHCTTENFMLYYRKFLTEMIWRMGDPLERLFAPRFKGEFRRLVKHTDRAGLPEHFGSLSVFDSASTVTTCAPLVTCAASPDLTACPDTLIEDSVSEGIPHKLPTLKYVAVIETDTDKAIYALEPSHVNEKDRKLMDSAQAMCNAMISKGYGGKVKLQDMMDIAVKMAKK